MREEEEIARLVNRGRWYIKNALVPAIQLRKYRSMKQRYYPDTPEQELVDRLARDFEAVKSVEDGGKEDKEGPAR